MNLIWLWKLLWSLYDIVIFIIIPHLKSFIHDVSEPTFSVSSTFHVDFFLITGSLWASCLWIQALCGTVSLCKGRERWDRLDRRCWYRRERIRTHQNMWKEKQCKYCYIFAGVWMINTRKIKNDWSLLVFFYLYLALIWVLFYLDM